MISRSNDRGPGLLSAGWGRAGDRTGSLCLALVLASVIGCASTGPRFDPSVTAGFVREPMRRLETEHVELYYPQSYADAARRIGARLDHCAAVLRGKSTADRSQDKLLVYLTLANFNNAYVQGKFSGAPLQMVLPLHNTLEEDNFLLLGTVNEGNTACHEALHYVQDQQTHGFWWYANILGGALNTPSQGLERWFTEGLAVWTEGHIDLETGRPHSPFWNGMYAAAMTTRGNRPRSGDLSLDTRDLYGSGAYLTSQHFIDFLVRRFGEEKLWELIDREGGAIVPDVGISLLFKAVYGQTLGSLFEAYGDEMVQEPIRARPSAQKVLGSDAGQFARIAVSRADGSIAEISAGDDFPVRLVIREATGRIRLNYPLTRFLPGREWIGLSAEGISGLRFTSDGSQILFVADTLAASGDDATTLWALDAKTGRTTGHWDLFGYGGDLAPDDHSYVYVEVRGDTESLVRLDLRSGQREQLATFEGARSIGAPAYSPDGRRIAFSLWNGSSFDLALRDEDGRISMLTQDGRANYGPRWIDDEHLVFLRELRGRWQVYAYNLTTRMLAPITDAPYLAFDPMPRPQGDLVFLNREGIHYTLDSVPLATDDALAEHGSPDEPPPALQHSAVPPVRVVTDDPAKPGDGFLVPSLHMPFLQPDIPSTWKGPWGVRGGLSLAGSDRLGIHNYSITASVDSFTIKRGPNFVASYSLAQFAPLLITAQLARVVSLTAEGRQAALAFDRSFWDVPLHVAFIGQQQLESEAAGGVPNTVLVGPTASTSYNAYEATPYGGVRRSIRLSLSGGIFPAFLGSSGTVGDVRPGVGFTLPLPISLRHSLSVDVVGHATTGAGSILQVGGLSPDTLFAYPLPSFGRSTVSGPPVLLLGEYLRGYEEHSRFTSRAVIGEADYNYPIVIDRGQTALLWMLPSVFVREIDVNLFGSGAYLDGGYLRAVGGSITLATVWGQQTPVSLTYQFAYRFDERLPPLHLVYLSL